MGGTKLPPVIQGVRNGPVGRSRCLTPSVTLSTIEILWAPERGLSGQRDERIRGGTMMNKTDVKTYKERLLTLRARLRGDVNKMADGALRKSRSQASGDLSSMPIHMADIGTDNFEQEFTLSLMQNEGETLAMIEVALERVEDGTYGQCEQCGARIPKARLNAIPYATMCVKCASELEEG